MKKFTSHERNAVIRIIFQFLYLPHVFRLNKHYNLKNNIIIQKKITLQIKNIIIYSVFIHSIIFIFYTYIK